MALVRVAIESLLVFLFWIARAVFAAFALATATMLVAAPALGGPEAPAWLGVITRASLLIGGTFLLSAVLLFVAPGLRAPAPGESEGPPAWLWLLGLMLIGLPALAWASAADLLALWREILVLLDRLGFWEEFERGGQYSGLVMMPIMAALFVPALEAIAAFFLIVAPLGLLALLPTRSRHFPRFFSMGVVCQAALVLASVIGADAFSKLATELTAAMNAAEGAEVQRAAGDLARASDVLTSTATAFVAPMLGHLVWLPVLLVSPQSAAFFRAGARPALPPIRSGAPIEQRGVPSARPTRARERNASLTLIVLGALMLLFGAGEALRARARYVSSDPAPGATLAAPPGAVRVRFERALDPSSRLRVSRTAPGEVASQVAVSSALDPGDAERATLTAALSEASAGIYHVNWHVMPAAGGSARAGSFRFAVGMPLPEDAAGGKLEDRIAGERKKRKTVLGGLVLMLLGAGLPFLPSAASPRKRL
jgi:methionine-rich copper-binding protein CopC